MERFGRKVVLEVGAGLALISEVARAKGLNTKIIAALDKNPEMWIEEGRKIHSDVPYLKAAAERIPFKDESFELVISHSGPPNVSRTKKEVIEVVREFKRVLKEGGEARFGMGNLNAEIFGESLFTPEEKKSLTDRQRIEKVRQRSLELLQSIDPNITQEVFEEVLVNKRGEEFRNPEGIKFYVLRKKEKKQKQGGKK